MQNPSSERKEWVILIRTKHIQRPPNDPPPIPGDPEDSRIAKCTLPSLAARPPSMHLSILESSGSSGIVRRSLGGALGDHWGIIRVCFFCVDCSLFKQALPSPLETVDDHCAVSPGDAKPRHAQAWLLARLPTSPRALLEGSRGSPGVPGVTGWVRGCLGGTENQVFHNNQTPNRHNRLNRAKSV